MLSLLETGQAFYVLMGICVLGVLTRLITRNLYRRLMKESTNLAAAKNKGLKELRQRAENAYHLNQGMRDTGVWLEHQLGDLRFRGMTLNGWANFSVQLTWLCLLAGGICAFASYWNRLDTYYIVLYGGGSILMAMFFMMFDGNYYMSRRDQLIMALQDHLENNMFPRLERVSDRNSERTAGGLSGGVERTALADRTGFSDRDNASERKSSLERTGSLNRTGSLDRTGSSERSRLSERNVFAERPGRKERGFRRREKFEEAEETTDCVPSSQEQTAAAAMPPSGGKSADNNWLKELGPEEAKVIGDILKQYLT